MSNTKGTSVISNPQGGGAQSGLGEKFSPDLFTGTGNFSVPIAVPPGRNGFQPELTLGYSSGNGNGVFGMGWALSVPGISRKTSKGIPVYNDKTDVFILSGAEDLVPVAFTQETTLGVSWEQTTYRPRTEGLFARIIHHKKSNGENYWEVRSKDGLISWYGTPEVLEGDPAVIANPEKRDAIYSWNLTKTQDPFGNVILYEYIRELIVNVNNRSYDQLYLSKIKYAQYVLGSETKYLCEVLFDYDQRPDPFSNYKQGFEVRTTKRCISINTFTNAAQLIKQKIYFLNYDTNLPLNGASLLRSIVVEGQPEPDSIESPESMPPLEFGFSVFEPAKHELQEISGPLPFNSLSDPGFELVDLDGNGLPDLLQLNGTARYWTNKGNGKFSTPRNMNLSPSVQLGMPGVQFMDTNGDGRTDLFVNNGQTAGYFPGAFHKVWDANGFRPYKNIPSFSFADPEVQLIDLDGDGITDVLRNGAKFECFYNNPEKGFYKVGVVSKTFADFSFADPRIRFADMTGDGLQDIVLISSGRVQYWPNMGYGRFGNKINMRNAPLFPEQYDPAQVLIGDLDGDGQADIAFVENNTVTLYVNQSGNGFSAPVKIKNTPRVGNPKALRIIDVLGTGQVGILWSFGADFENSGKMYFLDLTKGNKPYVLQEMNNNMGSLTRVEYGSSVYHYLRDEVNPVTRWKTDLPFPVQVVNKVEVIDFLSGGKLVTEYNYHNGYWDGVEREFRGFAQVDSLDTETFTQYNTIPSTEALEVVTSGGVEKQYDQSLVTAQYYSPPVKTKSWFYVGAVGDSFSRWHEPNFTDEYWSGDSNMFQRPQDMLSLLASLPRPAQRAALRTLRGTLLRSELYALDGSALEKIPYTVTESRMSLRMEFDPVSSSVTLSGVEGSVSSSVVENSFKYIFFPFNIAQRTTQYERGSDPMHNFSFTKNYDSYGQALAQLSVGVPRSTVPTAGGGAGNYLASYGVTDYIYSNISGGQYMVNRVKRSISYDATMSVIGKTIFQLRDDVFSNDDLLPVLACTLNFYDGAEFVGEDYGIIGAYGAQVRSETLIITDAIITEAYGVNTPQCFKTSPDWSTDYPAAFAGLMQDSTGHMGYTKKTGDPYITGWYAESARVKYDFQDSGLPIEEQLGRVLQSRDVFDSWSSIEYDVYLMMPVKSSQYLYLYGGSDNSLDTYAEYDYRIMQPYKITDVNENITVFDFSPLGLLRATAVIGKGTEGDYKSGSGGFYDRYVPSVRMEYDFFAFKTNGNPVWVKTINRQQHYADFPLNDATITKVEYSDGFGRLLQTRVQAEDVIFGNSTFGSSGLPANQSAANAAAIGIERDPLDPLNVVVSGWQIYNNKGKVVEKYEPFFDKGFNFTAPEVLEVGVKIKLFYDALGRVVKTINPDNSQQWVIFGTPFTLNGVSSSGVENGTDYSPSPWISFIYDANDLAPLTNPTGSNVPASHYYTPKSTLLDALGRTIKTTEYFDNDGNTYVYTNTIVMQYQYDIRGNLLEVKDPYNRIVFEHVYDLRISPSGGGAQRAGEVAPLKTYHIDQGISTVVFDAMSKAIESHDAKGAMALSAFDVISRPTHSWAKNDSTFTDCTLRNYLVYGETATTPSVYNLNGKIYNSYDEAGLIKTPLYDFKGNLLTKIRNVIDSAELKTTVATYDNYIIDWTGLPAILDTFDYQTDMVYDALNRITELELPEDLDTERKKVIPTYNNAGALQKVDLYSPTGPTTTNYVENIVYNAKGQRLLIAFGNSRMTRYAYDNITFRLLRQRTEGYSKSVVGDTITYAYTGGTNKQDDGFNYDLIGNIMNIFVRVNDCGISGSPNELDRTFEYDPIYRLTYADGRESNTQSGNSYLYDDAPAPVSPDPSYVRAYNRTYVYDKLGNVQSVVQGGTNGFTRNFVYNTGVNTLQKIETAAPAIIESYTYDPCGNTVTTNLNRYYIWNHANQLLCYKNQAGMSDPTVFTQYDYAGQDRVSKMVRTGTAMSPIYERTIYIDGIFEYVKLENGTTYEKNYIHIMDDKSRIAEVRINVGTAFPGDITDDIVYILEDQIGSSVVRLSTSGTVIDEEEYYPFGDSSLRTFTYKRYRYVGKEKDAESGLYYYGARYYAAWTCRFISVDPLAEKYNQLTPYQNAGNNPINDFDIDGMQSNSTPEGGNNNNSGSGSKQSASEQPGGQASNVTYKGGIQIYEAAEAKGGVPGGQSKAGESFKVGDYDVLPNYTKSKDDKLVFSHYTASITINQVKPGGGTEQAARIDYVFGKADLQVFKDKVTLFATAANMIFGADVHLTRGKIEMLNGNGAGAYVKEQYTSDPIGAAFSFVGGFYGLMRGQYFKPNGGKESGDFMTNHSTKHMYNEGATSTKSKTQFGQNVDVARLTEHTMKYGNAQPQLDAAGNTYATKYSANYGFNVGTKAMPTDAVRVFINHVDPAKSSVFPYISRTK